MTKLRGALLFSFIMLSMFAFIGFITPTQATDGVTITKVSTNKQIYVVGENIVITAWVTNSCQYWLGPLCARIYAMGMSGKPNWPITPYGHSLIMTLVDAATGKWKGTYGPIPGPANPLGFEGTYVIIVYAEWYTPPWPYTYHIVTRSTTCFVAYSRMQSTVAKFVKATSPSRVALGKDFNVSVQIKNPSSATQTLTVNLILPSGMNKVWGVLTQTITLAPGQSKTLKWTLKSTTTTNKLVKINVLKTGSLVAKLHWYIRDPANTT